MLQYAHKQYSLNALKIYTFFLKVINTHYYYFFVNQAIQNLFLFLLNYLQKKKKKNM